MTKWMKEWMTDRQIDSQTEVCRQTDIQTLLINSRKRKVTVQCVWWQKGRPTEQFTHLLQWTHFSRWSNRLAETACCLNANASLPCLLLVTRGRPTVVGRRRSLGAPVSTVLHCTLVSAALYSNILAYRKDIVPSHAPCPPNDNLYTLSLLSLLKSH